MRHVERTLKMTITTHAGKKIIGSCVFKKRMIKKNIDRIKLLMCRELMAKGHIIREWGNVRMIEDDEDGGTIVYYPGTLSHLNGEAEE